MNACFIKFLPVEGEIQEGDSYLYEGKIMQANGLIGFHSSIVNKVKKAKPFFCSRDIQVGDIVERFESNAFWGDYHKNLPVREIKPTDKGSLDGGKSLLILLGGRDADGWDSRAISGNWFYMREFFKVICEAPPEAMRINEMDEFDIMNIGSLKRQLK